MPGAAGVGDVAVGTPHVLGAHLMADGVNFCVFSKSAESIEVVLYDEADAAGPARVIALDPRAHRTYHYWHAFVPGLRTGQIYAYRARGPFAPERGLRFDGNKVLLDPYGRAVVEPAGHRRAAGAEPGPNDAVARKSVVADVDAYDWDGDVRPARPFTQTVIYEMHVGGFTRHPNSGVAPGRRGTYAGVIEKIPYLVDLGVTAVELLPVFAFDWQDAPAGRTNHWGYQPVSFFAPHPRYCSRPGALAALDEFRDLVKALHRAGLEVILDVVYNHTAEGDGDGPTMCLRGLENSAYYLIAPGDGATVDFTGCGNTLQANHSVVRRLVIDSLHYWVEVMHVDGFRFDLASILARDEHGEPMANPPVLWDIDSDPVLADTKLIAEAWDTAGLYQVGAFVGDSWKEWNGRFRDDVRSFVRGDPGMVPRLADRLVGSPDLYADEHREPEQSINFVTSHDGFTLEDLVSYDHKHNEENGEGNRDGTDDNTSWNCGVEGPTDDPAVLALRRRQVKNLLAVNLLSLGAPMLLMGDEVRRTQHGNNNAYCQDNEISWFDWSDLERNADIHRFVRLLIGLRSIRESVRVDHHLTLDELMAQAHIRFHGVHLDAPDLGWDSRSLALSATNLSGTLAYHFMLNAYWEPLTFQLPALPDRRSEGWRRVLDTSLPSPDDIVEPTAAVPVDHDTYRLEARATAALIALAPPQR